MYCVGGESKDCICFDMRISCRTWGKAKRVNDYDYYPCSSRDSVGLGVVMLMCCMMKKFV